jgi:hypothetical protein
MHCVTLTHLPRKQTKATMPFHVNFASRVKFEGSSSKAATGFDMVFSGVIEIREDEVRLYEKEDWDNDDDHVVPTFTAPFPSIESVKTTKIVSGHGNYCGGKIAFVGTFDRGLPELITLKMDIPTYLRPLVALLKSGLAACD